MVVTAAVHVGFLSHLLSYTHSFLLGEGLMNEKCLKAISFHYLVIKSNF